MKRTNAFIIALVLYRKQACYVSSLLDGLRISQGWKKVVKQPHLGRHLIEGYHMTRTGLHPVTPLMQHADVNAEAPRQTEVTSIGV